MTGQTIAEKILSAKAGRRVYAGEVVVASVDGCMASDTTAPLAIEAFEAMGGTLPFDPSRTFLAIDHASPAPNERIAALHRGMRQFAERTGCVLFDAGEGIAHQLLVERGHVTPGQLFIGADSHTCTYGAVTAFATGVGSTDLGAVMFTGKIWLRAPQTLRVILEGRLDPTVSAKDLTLALVGQVGLAGATYCAVQIEGETLADLTLSDRMTLANMAVEMGAKTALIVPDHLPVPEGIDTASLYPDPGAVYAKTLRIDARSVRQKVSLPHAPDRVVAIEEVVGTPITYAFVGTCVNGRLADLREAARILRGRHIAPGVRLLIAPASREVFLHALENGAVRTLTEAGATFLPAGCGPCVGTHLGVPGDDETVVSTGNRNFRGRMGNPRANVYLGSAATVAAAALEGRIVDPAPYLAEALS